MNILFLTVAGIRDLEQRGIYNDLLRVFVKNGHNVTVAAPAERRFNESTNLKHYDHYSVLRIKVGNIQKTNIIEKGISTVLLESQFLSAIKKYLSDTVFDLVIYSTPPITFARVISYIKNRDSAKAYLLLKDIFPQNAVDLGMFKKNSLLYKFFRSKEKKLYKISDVIGCMSDANVRYLLEHNPEIDRKKVVVCPNAIEVQDCSLSLDEKNAIKEEFGIPLDKTVFIYGGNLGKPQGIDFLIKSIDSQKNNDDVFFVIVGSGTEYSKIEMYSKTNNSNNLTLLPAIQRDKFDKLVASCDVGMIFLDNRFTIPNFPSRLLSYMQAGIPVYAVTDVNTDIGKVIVDGDFGWWSQSEKIEDFISMIDVILRDDLAEKGTNAKKYLLENYTVERNYEIIMER